MEQTQEQQAPKTKDFSSIGLKKNINKNLDKLVQSNKIECYKKLWFIDELLTRLVDDDVTI